MVASSELSQACYKYIQSFQRGAAPAVVGLASWGECTFANGGDAKSPRIKKISCFAHPTTRIILEEYPILARPAAAAARPSQKPCRYLRNREWYQRSAGVKTTSEYKIKDHKKINHCTVAWVTRSERPKGMKDVVK